MRYLIGILLLLLLVLHQDNWFWEDDTLVFGFIPIGLFYHACISVAASVTWFLATKFAWPHGLSDGAETSQQGSNT
ncbi:MAG: hypothetical protein CMJ81_00520 [Planctomycetaceae bacterium]|nr:hypothetical protein [Planctomycetaceae bacterium]MBP62202.1 hypothetical protein [Planctomycetaceae bacterium]